MVSTIVSEGEKRESPVTTAELFLSHTVQKESFVASILNSFAICHSFSLDILSFFRHVCILTPLL